MKLPLRYRSLSLIALLLFLTVVTAVLYLQRAVVNIMHPALDKLSAVPLVERWSHPEMLRIRELGTKAVPSLRRVLREKSSPATQVLLWVKGTWPGATNYYSHFPDLDRLTERRWAACQVLQTLGPAGQTAAPEILQILKSNDLRDLNAATMALWAMGIDRKLCEQLDELLEKGVQEHGRVAIVAALAMCKPPSTRTLKALTVELSDSSSLVRERAAESLGALGVRTPEAVAALKQLQSTSTNELVLLSASAALWDLEKDSRLVLAPVFRLLQDQLTHDFPAVPGGGSGGQGLTGMEQLFLEASQLFARMGLNNADRSQALDILETCCNKSGRIFVRMLLLPSMLELGWPRDKCLEVCRTGLNQPEEYYRLQAAQLLTPIGQKHSLDEINLETLLHDPDVGVRVYAAKAHWAQHRQSNLVVPVLVEALDRSKHQSYYYAEVQPAALTVLRDIGPEASAATGPLGKLLTDPNPAIAKLASEALNKIER